MGYFHCPVVNVEHLRSLVPQEAGEKEARSGAAPVVDVTQRKGVVNFIRPSTTSDLLRGRGRPPTTSDLLRGRAELLGFDDYIPPYATASGEGILKGVNYASAAAGIRDETGRQLVRNYKNTVSQVVNILGDEASAANFLSKCIYSLGMGSNDYLNNYFMPQNYPTSRQYTPAQYADVLIQQYSQQIRTLYKYGARKLVLIGVGQIGCSPNALAQNSQDGSTCVQ
ncbi:hypothetical protein RJ639_021433 [Escallonia herrerae]|uniref:GDSL esterase/lipase n=1 Tax=Escallonia herrerae TaxID=1293975 RepID=A0AA88V3H7_9ASTE|nr:hypothetical protein RJ639_021433 [Escallonia herrerae]